MKKKLVVLLVTAVILMSFTSDKPAYILYDQNGKEVKYAKMLKEMEGADFIFFGELHTDPIAHWMQFELTKALFDHKKENFILGAEMFEADNQLIMDEYLSGIYPTNKYEAEIRLWDNYQTDYKPVVEFAKENGIPLIATNIPRRYASMVFVGGFEALVELSDMALSYIAPLPIAYDPELKCYKDMLDMGKTPMGMDDSPTGMPAVHGMGMPKINMENLPKAQAAKDATMAHFIMENWTEGKTMFHFNGSYHSNNYQGIIWHLQQQNKDLKIVTINTVLQEEIKKLEEEHLNTADYIICVPESMTRTKR
ncbi:MAG: ChaN family lipoprotein [Bacteroidetes bacterium]|nr:ChaN family lipoprotein [Bacteroidota bacterium]